MTIKPKSDRTPAPNLRMDDFADLEFDPRESNELLGPSIVDPGKMTEIVNFYQHLELMAQTEPVAKKPLINWKRHFNMERIYDEYLDFDLINYPFVPPPSYNDADAWLRFVRAEYKKATGKSLTQKVLDALTEKEMDALYKFQAKPTRSVANTHPLLREIPDVTKMAKLIEAERQRVLAGILLENVEKPTCLVDHLCRPPEGLEDVFKGTLQCWVFLVPDEIGIQPNELDDAQLFNISATFVDVQEDGSARLVAAITGFYIVPRKGNYVMSEDTFHNIMDAHSAYLNDVWKAVVGRFLPKRGCNDFYDLYNLYGDISPEIPGIASVSIEVHPAYRGHKISSLLLGFLSSMTDSACFCDYLIPKDTDGMEYDTFVEDNLDMFARIRLYVLPVEGTEPEPSQIVANPLLAYDTRPMKPKKVVNAQVEKKRMKLEKYFSKIGDESEVFDVQTYNPWDYPVT